jgi:hypothetical protein
MVSVTRFAQFIILCSASNLAEVRCISSPRQSASPAKTRASSGLSRAHGHHLRPSTNCYKLSVLSKGIARSASPKPTAERMKAQRDNSAAVIRMRVIVSTGENAWLLCSCISVVHEHNMPGSCACHPPRCLGMPRMLLTASHPATALGLHYGQSEQCWHS